ncbi:MAG TPA: hypothetical protein VIR63_05330 [Pontiella sp.]
MSKSLLWALVLLVLCIVSFIFTEGSVNISMGNLVFKGIPTPIAMLGYTSFGIAIGVLLKK